MNKNNLKVGTRVVFNPIDGSFAIAEGTIIKGVVKGNGRLFTVRVVSESGAIKDWACGADDVISIEPKPGAWGPRPGLWGAK